MYLFLPLKRHFGFSGFDCLTFLLEHFDPKIVSRVLYVLQKIAKYPDADADGRGRGRTSKFKRVPHKSPSGNQLFLYSL